MATRHESDVEVEIERQILAVLCEHRKLTFTSLADAVPKYRWRELFGALNRLRKRQQIELSTLPWDYEVVLRTPGRVHSKL